MRRTKENLGSPFSTNRSLLSLACINVSGGRAGGRAAVSLTQRFISERAWHTSSTFNGLSESFLQPVSPQLLKWNSERGTLGRDSPRGLWSSIFFSVKLRDNLRVYIQYLHLGYRPWSSTFTKSSVLFRRAKRDKMTPVTETYYMYTFSYRIIIIERMTHFNKNSRACYMMSTTVSRLLSAFAFVEDFVWTETRKRPSRFRTLLYVIEHVNQQAKTGWGNWESTYYDI